MPAISVDSGNDNVVIQCDGELCCRTRMTMSTVVQSARSPATRIRLVLGGVRPGTAYLPHVGDSRVLEPACGSDCRA